jgi:DNA-binding winged helix-turn-helix (wHTH) protein
MPYEFQGFRLDDERRELTFEGDEVSIQPKVFDVLLYLVEQRDRVVSKDELLDELWPGVAVADGSLKRAISLARSALRRGEAAHLIRTYATQGYRFADEVRTIATEDPRLLTKARAAFEAHAWDDAIDALSEADRAGGLEGEDLERWAIATLSTGRAADAIAPFERALAAFAAGGDRRGAARAALWLSLLHYEQRELTIGRGWLRRAEGYLVEGEVSSEHGRLAWLRSRFAMADGDLEASLVHAAKAQEVGHAVGDANVEIIGLMFRGLSLVALGDVESGVEMHDEAAAAVLTEQVEPWVGGFVYCGLIFTCRHRADWRRACEWTSRFTDWCAERSLSAYPGTCRLHRAEVLQFRGRLVEAESEVVTACDELARYAPWAEGEGRRLLGDLHQLRGDIDAAEEEYQRAHELGWDPQPGLAMVHVARGRFAAAMRGLRRSLDDSNWANRQRRATLLVHLIRAAVSGKDAESARDALAELREHRSSWSTPSLVAAVSQAEAELRWLENDRATAIKHLCQAVKRWQRLESPLNLARARLRLAEWFAIAGDQDAAELELAAATTAIASLPQGTLRSQLAQVRDLVHPPSP